MTVYFNPNTAPLDDVRCAIDEAVARWTRHMQARDAQQHQADEAQIDASYLMGVVLSREEWGIAVEKRAASSSAASASAVDRWV